MSKRPYLSGSQKRKRVAAQKAIAEKLPKLTSFFTVDETNRLSDSSPSSSQNQDTSEFQREQEKEITWDKSDNISKRVANVNTHTQISDAESSTSSSNDLLTTSLKNVCPDPGTYRDEILTEEVRDIWTRKGPEFFQNKNCDFCETATIFPDSSGKTKTRYLTRNIFTRKLTNGESLERN